MVETNPSLQHLSNTTQSDSMISRPLTSPPHKRHRGLSSESPCSLEQHISTNLIRYTLNLGDYYIYIDCKDIPIEETNLFHLRRMAAKFRPKAVEADSSGYHIVFGPDHEHEKTAKKCRQEFKGKMFSYKYEFRMKVGKKAG